MEITVWQRVLIIAVSVTVAFALLLCFAASSGPAFGLEAASNAETPWPRAATSSEDGVLSGKGDPIRGRVLADPMPTPDPDEYEPDNAKHQASPISVGDPQRHNFQRLDEDWVKFWAWAGNSYIIRTFDLAKGCNTVLCLYDAGRTEMECDNDGGEERRASRVDWTANENGVYFVRVSQDNPWVTGNLSYTLAISEVVRCRDPFEPDNTPQDAKPITEGTRTFHGPCGGDEDWASFEAVGGEVYAIWTSNLTGNNDTVLALYATSDVIDTDHITPTVNDDAAEDIPASRIVWQAPADGTYLVKISPFEPTAGGCDLRYVLHVDALPAMPTPTPTPTPPSNADEPDPHERDDAMHEAKRIAVNGGAVESYAFQHDDDEDWIKFWAWAGYTYTIKTEVGPGTDTTLKLYDRDRKKLGENDDDPNNPPASIIKWLAPENGSYFVRVAPPDAGGIQRRRLASPYGLTYSLAITETIPCREEEYEPDNSWDQAKPVEVDGDAQRRCFYVPCFDRYHQPDTADWVSFEAETWSRYEIRTFDLTGMNDTTLELHDAVDGPVLLNGDEVVSDDHADDSLASRIVWTAPPDETHRVTKTYYVKVAPFDARIGGCEACYSLQVNMVPSYAYLPLVLKPPACPDEHEPDNDPTQCEDWPPLEPDEAVSGTICQQHIHRTNGDLVERDWYWFEIDTLRHIEVDLEVPDGVNYDLYLYVGREQDGECIGYWEGSTEPTRGADEHISWPAECTDKYYVVVKSLGDYDNRNPYTLRLTLE